MAMKDRFSPSLEDLESRLQRALQPIALSAEHLQRVRRRIRYPSQVRAAQRMFEWEFWFIIIGGVLTTFMLILTLARALFYLFGKK